VSDLLDLRIAANSGKKAGFTDIRNQGKGYGLPSIVSSGCESQLEARFWNNSSCKTAGLINLLPTSARGRGTEEQSQ